MHFQNVAAAWLIAKRLMEIDPEQFNILNDVSKDVYIMTTYPENLTEIVGSDSNIKNVISEFERLCKYHGLELPARDIKKGEENWSGREELKDTFERVYPTLNRALAKSIFVIYYRPGIAYPN